mmetsp:Transcript_11493/g.36853  ORF Transcript_11493/g.36853 Transcript_11493/m.36853 type:complete len:112 (+) Transcript_11493:107-442(+)
MPCPSLVWIQGTLQQTTVIRHAFPILRQNCASFKSKFPDSSKARVQLLAEPKRTFELNLGACPSAGRLAAREAVHGREMGIWLSSQFARRLGGIQTRNVQVASGPESSKAH